MEEVNQDYIFDRYTELELKAIKDFLSSPGSELVKKVLTDKLEKLKLDYWQIDLTGENIRVPAASLKGFALGLEFLNELDMAIDDELKARGEKDLKEDK
jgi:hypothetical protein